MQEMELGVVDFLAIVSLYVVSCCVSEHGFAV
jgi:hypothetical protein